MLDIKQASKYLKTKYLEYCKGFKFNYLREVALFGLEKLHYYYNKKSCSKFLTEKWKKNGMIWSDERKIVHLEQLKHVWAN